MSHRTPEFAADQSPACSLASSKLYSIMQTPPTHERSRCIRAGTTSSWQAAQPAAAAFVYKHTAIKHVRFWHYSRLPIIRDVVQHIRFVLWNAND